MTLQRFLRRALFLILLSASGCAGQERIGDDATTSDGVVDEDAHVDSATFDSTMADATCRDVLLADLRSDVPPYPCAAPLSDDVTYASAPSPAMCTEAHGTFERWACGCRGYQAIYYVIGTDCLALQLFDANTGAHVAKLTECGGGGWQCAEGPPYLPQLVPFCCASDIPFLCGGAGEEHCMP